MKQWTDISALNGHTVSITHTVDQAGGGRRHRDLHLRYSNLLIECTCVCVNTAGEVYKVTPVLEGS